MKFSVIIPTFNRAYVLRRAIDSVLNQKYQDYDLWIVDDGSTDETPKLLQSYPQINIIKTDNRGVSAARNSAIEQSKGEWKSFLDSDDEWLPNKLKLQAEFIENNPGIQIVHGEEVWIRKGKRVNQMKKHKKSGGWIFEKCLPLCLISPSTVSIHKNIFADVGMFREDFEVCEDYDLWLKITSKYEVGFIEDAIIRKYGGHDDQLSAKYFGMDYWRVKAMYDCSLSLKSEALKKEATKKTEILIKGYLKHNNEEKILELEELLQYWKSYNL